MQKNYFIRLFKYNHWANTIIANLIEEKKINNEDALKIFSHVVNAQYIWLSRITGNKELHKPVWSLHSIQDIKKFLPENLKLWMSYLNDLNETELNRSISYSNSEGHSFNNTVSDMLPHLSLIHI